MRRAVIGGLGTGASAAALLAAALLGGCGGSKSTTTGPGGSGSTGSTTTSGTTGNTTTGSTSSSSGTSSSTVSSSSGGPDGGTVDHSVYQHHKNGNRDGLYIDAAFTQAAAAGTKVLASFVGMVTTTMYAQPLYVVDGPGGDAAFIVATEDNHVTTYNATTGAMIWDVGPSTIGAYATKNPPGGSVGSNHIGITGTPYIDIGSRTIFFDAMVTPDNNNTFHHTVFGLSLDTGAVQTNWPVDVSATVTGFNSGIQNQRGALQFVNGVLYVPYGGYDGDGGNYYGSVVGFPASNPKTPTWWHTTASKGGVWGPGALPTDGTNVYPVTGNTSGTNGTWGGGEAVIRLTPGPAFSGNAADYFAPSNWQSLDDSDTDLGGASELLVDMPGAAVPHLVAAGGKDGNLYLLDRANLGGIGGQLLTVQVSLSQIKGAPAWYTTAQGTYVALHIENGTGSNCPNNQQGNMVVMKITQSPLAATTAWCSTQSGLSSPMVTTTDGMSEPIVWNANNALYGWDGDTGSVIVDGTNTGMSSSVQGWNTPIDAQGKIAVGVNGQLYVFTP
jgi:hypothetical protein